MIRLELLDRLERLADRIESLSRRVGTASAWLYPVLVVVLIVNVVLRYAFGRGSIELEELQWHLYSTAFLLGLAYTYAEDEHVRVDVLRARLGPRARAWIELCGSLLLLAPFCAIVATDAFDFFWRSLLIGERSAMPSGLPARWIIKGMLFCGLALLGLQALAVALRSAVFLRGRT